MFAHYIPRYMLFCWFISSTLLHNAMRKFRTFFRATRYNVFLLLSVNLQLLLLCCLLYSRKCVIFFLIVLSCSNYSSIFKFHFSSVLVNSFCMLSRSFIIVLYLFWIIGIVEHWPSAPRLGCMSLHCSLLYFAHQVMVPSRVSDEVMAHIHGWTEWLWKHVAPLRTWQNRVYPSAMHIYCCIFIAIICQQLHHFIIKNFFKRRSWC